MLTQIAKLNNVLSQNKLIIESFGNQPDPVITLTKLESGKWQFWPIDEDYTSPIDSHLDAGVKADMNDITAALNDEIVDRLKNGDLWAKGEFQEFARGLAEDSGYEYEETDAKYAGTEPY